MKDFFAKIKHVKARRFAILLLAIALVLVVMRVVPKPALSSSFSSSRSVTAANGELLRLTLASDQQYRLWVPLADVSPRLQEAFLLYEDRWFYWHPGLNPFALLRASIATGTGARRIGASTITMQLARRLYQIDSRSVSGKLQQACAALWLEMRYSKHDILEAYLNSVPFGGNIEGVAAASLTYWRKSARDLTLPEAINLAVIPQNPRKRLGSTDALNDAQATTNLVDARQRLAKLWVQRHPVDAQFVDARALAQPFFRRRSLPFLAPHAVDYLLRANDQREVKSSIDLRQQQLLERVLSIYVKSRAEQGISNASALLLDTNTMQVKAMVGSADYFNDEIAGQVNGIFAKRSPGSTLKPFIYGLALDQGLIHSATILKDTQSNFGAFAPENFDGRFAGPIPAHQALIRSRNVPAVELASRLSRPNLYDFLKLVGAQKLAAESHYGLALALGGAELSMEELAQLYASLANRGQWQAMEYTIQNRDTKSTMSQLGNAAINSSKSAELQVLSPEAAFIVQDMLRQTPRPDTYAAARPAVAWKTGTSWGFRDAWTAGIFGRYVLLVWVGNFNGQNNPAFIGVEAAAPLFFRIVDALRAEKLDPGEIASAAPSNLQRIQVCAASGDLPNAECPVTAPAWMIAGKSPLKQSTLHRTVMIDTRTGQRACQSNAYTKNEVFEFWPSDMRALFKKAGLPLRTPPSGECPNDAVAWSPNAANALSANAPANADINGSDTAPHITSPLRGVVHLQRLNKPEALSLKAEADVNSGTLRWFANDAFIGSTKAGEGINWTPPNAGRYTLRVVDAHGLGDSREVVVENVE